MVGTVTEDGYLDLAFGGVTARIDVYQENYRLVDLNKTHKDDAAGQNKAIVDMMVEHGYPKPSYWQACQYARAIYEAVEHLEKKVSSGVSPSTNSGQANSSDSQSSTCPQPEK